MSRLAYLVRHAHAGDRSAWKGPDERRPLSAKGRGQAEAIAAALSGAPLARLLSSPAQRCVETLEPLSRARGMRVEIAPWLAEGTDPAETLREMEHLQVPSALSTHGDVIPGVLSLLDGAGAEVDPPVTWPKGSVWLLSGDDDAFHHARLFFRP